MRKHQAFTLIELLIAVAIIGILAAAAVPQYQLAQERARLSFTYAQLNTLRTAINAYALDHSFPPLTVCPTSPLCKNQYAALTTPIAYLKDLSGCRDIFAPILTSKDITLKDLQYWYYGTILDNQGHPLFYHPHYFALMSWGPDRAAYVWITLTRLMTRRDGGEWIKPYLYSPSNGLISKGDIIADNAGLLQ